MTRTAVDIGLFAAVLAAVTGIAALLGAANLGTALTFGELAGVAVLVWAMTRD